MPNKHFLVKFWTWRKAGHILTHEAKALLELFCLQPIVFGWRQNSSSSFFPSRGKTKMHDFTLVDQDWIRLIIFKNFAGQAWIGFNYIGSGLDSDWNILQSAHLWFETIRLETSSLSVLSGNIKCDSVQKSDADWSDSSYFLKMTLNPVQFFKKFWLRFRFWKKVDSGSLTRGLTTRGDHGSGVPVSTPVGFCIFFGPDQESKCYVKPLEPESLFIFGRRILYGGVFTNVIS